MVVFFINFQIGGTLRRCCEEAPDCECSVEAGDNSPVLLPSPAEVPAPDRPEQPLRTPYWVKVKTQNIQSYANSFQFCGSENRSLCADYEALCGSSCLNFTFICDELKPLLLVW